ncbi:MAG: hypothetical protein EOO52_13110 [Gammaproteobacteria bacterium]|nr:MAG: hypothetical protein EOO52_13110 [Gammaproteobacteria bacterium]
MKNEITHPLLNEYAQEIFKASYLLDADHFIWQLGRIYNYYVGWTLILFSLFSTAIYFSPQRPFNVSFVYFIPLTVLATYLSSALLFDKVISISKKKLLAQFNAEKREKLAKSLRDYSANIGSLIVSHYRDDFEKNNITEAKALISGDDEKVIVAIAYALSNRYHSITDYIRLSKQFYQMEIDVATERARESQLTEKLQSL